MSIRSFFISLLPFALIGFFGSATTGGQEFEWRVQSGGDNRYGDILTASVVVFSPDSSIMAVGSSDGSVRLWDLTDGTETRKLVGHKSKPTSLSFSPDGKRVVTCADNEYPNGAFRVWSVASGECLYVQDASPMTPFCQAVSFHPDGKSFVAETHFSGSTGSSSGWTVDAYDAVTFRKTKQLASLRHTARDLMFSADGTSLLIGSEQSWQGPSLFDLQTNSKREFNRDLASAVISRDGRYVAAIMDKVDEAVVLDAATGSEIRRFSPSKSIQGLKADERCWSVEFATDSQSLFAKTYRCWIQWSISTGEVINHGFERSDNNRSRLRVSPNGRFIGQIDDESKVVLWDLQTATPVARFTSDKREDRWAVETRDGFFHHGREFEPAFPSFPSRFDRRAYVAQHNDATRVSAALAVLTRNENADVEVAGVPSTIATSNVAMATAQRVENGKPMDRRLFVLAVGVSEYADSNLSLRYAHADANALSKAFLKSKGRLFSDVQTQVYTNKQATVTNLKDGLDWLQRSSTSNDIVVVLFSGHGIRGERGLYYATHEANLNGIQYTCLNWETIALSLRGTKANQVIFLTDSCFAGSFSKSELVPQQAIAEKFKSASNVLVFASSRDRESSLEKEDWEHGAFTFAVLEALAGKSDLNGDRVVTVAELTSYVSKRVGQLTDGQQHPVVAQVSSNGMETVISRLEP